MIAATVYREMFWSVDFKANTCASCERKSSKTSFRLHTEPNRHLHGCNRTVSLAKSRIFLSRLSVGSQTSQAPCAEAIWAV